MESVCTRSWGHAGNGRILGAQITVFVIVEKSNGCMCVAYVKFPLLK